MAAQLLDQLKSLAAGFAETQRKDLVNALYGLAFSLETPQDALQRVMYSTLELPLARIGCDLKIFNFLVESKAPLTVAQLAEKTKADPGLLGRLLRAMAAFSMIEEVEKDTFAANKVCETLAVPDFQAGIYHNFDVVGPIYQNLPDYLKELNYAEPKDVAKAAFQRAYNTDEPAFVYGARRPETLQNLSRFMRAQRDGLPTWIDGYPVFEKTKDLKPDQPLFVDIGGSVGHESLRLRDRYPNIPGTVTVQDLPVAIDGLPAEHRRSNVDFMTHDFFNPQPIKGARFYYLRNVIHDHPDDKALKILNNIISVMADDSVILIDEMVLPDVGVPRFATCVDLTMMASFSARERTLKQWTVLLDKAGLKVNDLNRYGGATGNSVLEVIRA